MDSGSVSRLNVTKCCDCECICSFINDNRSDAWLRSVKRKFDDIKEGDGIYIDDSDSSFVARIGIENECEALRERVQSQQQSIQDLYKDLEEERNASSSAANEAMSMILRLQGEKAVAQMEARQFKCIVEEKMAHDQNELWILQDTLYKREQAIQSLTYEVHAYKYRLMSYGLSETEAGGEGDKGCLAHPKFPGFGYPPLKCNVVGLVTPEADDGLLDVDKYAFGEAPWDPHNLETLDHRISELEGGPKNNDVNLDFNGTKNIRESVVVNHCSRQTGNSRNVSNDDFNYQNGFAREMGPDSSSESPKFDGSCFQKTECVSHIVDYSNLKKPDDVSETSEDVGVRVYTIDSIQTSSVTKPKGSPGISGDGVTTPKIPLNKIDVEDPYIKNLFLRLQALETDRESMKQSLIAMRTEKAQLELFREIAQQLCKEATPQRRLHETKAPLFQRFSVIGILKWIMSFIFWRKKACGDRFGVSTGKVGLLMLLEKGPLMRK